MYRFLLLLLFVSACPFDEGGVAIENQLIHESEHWHILVDLRPKVPGHLILVPKRHIRDRFDLSLEEHIDLYEIELLVNLALQERIGPKTDNIQLEKNGEKTRPSPPGHFHIHAYPLTKSDSTAEEMLALGTKLFTQHFTNLPEEAMAEEVALYREAFLIAQEQLL